ncbi:MAG: IMPACT family protein [Saprospiraceae bacterium]
MKDSYLTIGGPSTGEYKDRGSKFIAFAFPLRNGEEWHELIEKVRKDHPKARHHCFAYRLGLTGDQFRFNDDGEPSGTAGRPILGQIDSFSLTNVIVIVVRYFGGTLLGTSGLIAAYKGSTQQALEAASIVEVFVKDTFRLHFDYAIMGTLMNILKKLDAEILHQSFESTAYVDISLRQSEREDFMLKLKALLAQVSLEEAASMDDPDGLKIEQLIT